MEKIQKLNYIIIDEESENNEIRGNNVIGFVSISTDHDINEHFNIQYHSDEFEDDTLRRDQNEEKYNKMIVVCEW